MASKKVVRNESLVKVSAELLDAIAARDEAFEKGDSRAHLLACNKINELQKQKKTR